VIFAVAPRHPWGEFYPCVMRLKQNLKDEIWFGTIVFVVVREARNQILKTVLL
jgi:hypothetical protein